MKRGTIAELARISGWEELKASLAHLLGGTWVLLGVAAMGWLIRWIEKFLDDPLWKWALKSLEEIDLVVLVALFGVTGLSLILWFWKRHMNGEHHSLMA
ncbi:MAG: hypothetical protein ACRYFU_16785 [Janthinobacterium lividum]